MNEIFSKALGVEKPGFIADIKFDAIAKRLDIWLDFIRGSVFSFEQDEIIGQYSAYDTIEKEVLVNFKWVNMLDSPC